MVMKEYQVVGRKLPEKYAIHFLFIFLNGVAWWLFSDASLAACRRSVSLIGRPSAGLELMAVVWERREAGGDSWGHCLQPRRFLFYFLFLFFLIFCFDAKEI